MILSHYEFWTDKQSITSFYIRLNVSIQECKNSRQSVVSTDTRTHTHQPFKLWPVSCLWNSHLSAYCTHKVWQPRYWAETQAIMHRGNTLSRQIWQRCIWALLRNTTKIAFTGMYAVPGGCEWIFMWIRYTLSFAEQDRTAHSRWLWFVFQSNVGV